MLLEPIDERRYRVLYVDDDEANLQAISYALGDELSIDVVSTAEGAIRMMRDHSYAVLLSDQRMPFMTGVELCELVAEMCPATVRMIFTAYADHATVVQAIERGRVSRYLLKPVRNEDLREALRFGIHHHHAKLALQRLERQLIESVPSHTIAAARAEIAHELGNMLAPLALRLEAVARVSRNLDGLEAERAEMLRDTVVAAQLYADQLHFAVVGPAATHRDDSMEAQPVEVAAAVVRFMRPMLPSGIELTLAAEATPTVRMSPAALAQIILSLVLNAKQALQEWGSGSIEVRVTSLGDVVEVRVSDNGPGIPDANLRMAFDAGFTTRRGAAGQGLTLARRLAWAAGATVSLENTHPGLRASIRFAVP